MAFSEEELVGLALKWVEENNRNPEEASGGVEGSTDLLATGVLDSIGFIELLTFLENEASCTIDLAELDPEDFVTVEGLCRQALKNGT